MDYFTSDLHLCHKFLLESRGYATIEDMNAGIVESINSTCTEDDTLYILGDLSCGTKKKEHHPYIEALKPKLILIKGNHDNREKNGKLSYQHLLHEFHHDLVRGFGEGPSKQMVHMYHYPLAHWFAQNKGVWHLHGHLHGSSSLIPGKIMDVGWDIYKRPLSFNEVKEYMDKQPIRANHHSGTFF